MVFCNKYISLNPFLLYSKSIHNIYVITQATGTILQILSNKFLLLILLFLNSRYVVAVLL